MKLITKFILLTMIVSFALMNIGALPANAYGDSFRVDLKVNLSTIEYLNNSSDTTNEELMEYHNRIMDIATEHCSNKEISELNDLFAKFLNDRTESSLEIYSNKVNEFIIGKPNYLVFFIIITSVVSYILYYPIKKKNNRYDN